MSPKNMKRVDPSVAAADVMLSAIAAGTIEPAFASVPAAGNGQPCAHPSVRHPDGPPTAPASGAQGAKVIGVCAPNRGLLTRAGNGRSSACPDQGFRRITGTR